MQPLHLIVVGFKVNLISKLEAAEGLCSLFGGLATSYAPLFKSTPEELAAHDGAIAESQDKRRHKKKGRLQTHSSIGNELTVLILHCKHCVWRLRKWGVRGQLCSGAQYYSLTHNFPPGKYRSKIARHLIWPASASCW
jgi:hypothetical protein